MQCQFNEFQSSTFLGINNITVTIKKGSRWYIWLTSEGGSCNNASTTYINDGVDNSIMDSEDKAVGSIDKPCM